MRKEKQVKMKLPNWLKTLLILLGLILWLGLSIYLPYFCIDDEEDYSEFDNVKIVEPNF